MGHMTTKTFQIGQRVTETDTDCAGTVVQTRRDQVLIQWDDIDGALGRTWSPMSDVVSA